MTNLFDLKNFSVNPKIDITQMTGIVVLIQLLFILFAYPIIEVNNYININSYIYIILLNLSLFASLFLKNIKSKKLLIILNWFFIIWINIRIISFLFQNPSNLEMIHPDFFSKTEIEIGLKHIFLANIIIITGIYLGQLIKFTELKIYKISDKIYSLKNQTFIWFLVILVAYFINFYLQTSIYSTPDKWGSNWGWLQSLFNPDIVMAIQIIIFMNMNDNKQLRKNQLILVIIGMSIFNILMMSLGSRGGPFRLLTQFLFVVIAISPILRIKLSTYLIIFLSLFILNVFTFNLGTAIRGLALSNLSYNSQSIKKILDHTNAVAKKGHWTGVKYTDESIRMINKIFDEDKLVKILPTEIIYRVMNNESFVFKFRNVFTRLNLFDYVVIIKNFNKDEEVVDKYFKSDYAIKNFINNIVPGEIFLEATIKTNRIFSYLYRDYKMEEIKSNFQSEPYTLYGIILLLSEKLYFLILFIVVFLTRFLFSILPEANNITNSSFTYIYLIYWSLLLSNFGIDHFFTVIAHGTASLLFIIALFYMFNKITNNFFSNRVKP
jgi:hypothetical protein